MSDDDADELAPVVEGWREAISRRFAQGEWSFNGLAKESGLDPGNTCRFIKGERDMMGRSLEKLCRALDLVLVPRERVR
jgi:hypothetical protein